MPNSIRVILVDAREGSDCVLDDLTSGVGAAVVLSRARTFELGLAEMTSGRHDVHLVAVNLGARSGFDLMRSYRASGGDGPVLLLAESPQHGEEREAIASGAADYLDRQHLTAPGVERAVRFAFESSRRASALRRVRDELELRVAQRTDSLETLNAALATEVAERRSAERALRETAREKDEFLATLAHELRNPLAPLSSATEILARTGDAPEEGGRRGRAVGVIERQVSHMVRLIDDLLDLSRITHGKLELRREWVTLSSVVESALETARPLLVGRHQDFSLLLPVVPVVLHVDPTRLAQILSNLLSNAAKYTEPGGRVTLRALRDGTDVVVTVADSGIGIPFAHIEHVFKMFGQGHRAHEAVAGGLGIGLALAKSLAEIQGGTLSASSEGEGKGSVFTLRIAWAAEEGLALVPAPAPERESSLPRRILVVDDNVEAALTLAELLALEGHETHVAHDGPSAVDAARRLSPDVAILDIGLPGFDGLEVARRLRAEPALQNLVLVALSGWVQADDRQRSIAAGFDHHLAKPAPFKSLEPVLMASSGGRGRAV